MQTVTPPNTASTDIAGVTLTEVRSRIPLKGWDSVKRALHTFAAGSPGAHGAEKKHLNDVTESHGAMGMGIYMLGMEMIHGAGATGRFADRILDEAAAQLAVRDVWSDSYEYEGPGPFFKSSITIAKSGRHDDIFSLHIIAAYVGDQPEIGLAEALGLPRALVRCAVAIALEPLDDRWIFNVARATARVSDVLPDVPQAEVVAGTLFDLAADDYHNKVRVPLYADDQIQVWLQPGAVEKRMVWSHDAHMPRTNTPRKRDTWTREGTVLSGEVKRWANDRVDTPTWEVVVETARRDWLDDAIPEYDPTICARIQSVARQLADALR